jgi:hypothetical protein
MKTQACLNRDHDNMIFTAQVLEEERAGGRVVLYTHTHMYIYVSINIHVASKLIHPFRPH